MAAAYIPFHEEYVTVSRNLIHLGSPLPSHKVCRRCGLVLPISAFRGRRLSPDGRQSYCRDCQRDWLREVPGRRATYRQHERARDRALDASGLTAARQVGREPGREARDRQCPDPRTPRVALERAR